MKSSFWWRSAARSDWLALGAIAAGLVLLSAGSAAAKTTSTSPDELLSKPILRKDGFKFSLDAFQGGPRPGGGRYPSSVFATLHKGSGSGAHALGELDSYDFFKGMTFTAEASLKSAHVKRHLRAEAGSIDMKFTATDPAVPVPVPKGCTGSPGIMRKGVLRGTFHLSANDLGTVKTKSIPARLERPYTIASCRQRQQHGTEISGSKHTGTLKAGRSFVVNVTRPAKRGDDLLESIFSSTYGSGFQFAHGYQVLAPRSDYTYSHNLSRATIKGYAAIHGSAWYKGTPAKNNMSVGTLDGDMSVHLASIGTVKPFTRGVLQCVQSHF
jgi:hypothetical protein